MVEKQQVVELETIVPQLVKVHEVIKEYIDKVVPVTVREEVIKEVPVDIERIVQVNSNYTEVKEVPTVRDRVVEVDRFKEVTNTQNYIERDIQVVDRYEQKEVPVYNTVEKIVEVPQVLEKIVERVVIMPQIVEVLKYVHEIYEEDNLGLCLSTDLAAVEVRYTELYGNAKKQLDVLLVELRALRTSHPNLRATIELIERFLLDFDKLAAAQRIVPVDREKIVEKEVTKGVLVPTNDLRGELALSLLVEKLVLELRRIKKQNSGIRFELDDEINLIFFS